MWALIVAGILALIFLILGIVDNIFTGGLLIFFICGPLFICGIYIYKYDKKKKYQAKENAQKNNDRFPTNNLIHSSFQYEAPNIAQVVQPQKTEQKIVTSTATENDRLRKIRYDFLSKPEPEPELYILPRPFLYLNKAEQSINEKFYEFVVVLNNRIKAISHKDWLSHVYDCQVYLGLEEQNETKKLIEEVEEEITKLNITFNSLRWKNPILAEDDSLFLKNFYDKFHPHKIFPTGLSYEKSINPHYLIQEFFYESGAGKIDTTKNYYNLFITPFFLITYSFRSRTLRLCLYSEVNVTCQESNVIFSINGRNGGSIIGQNNLFSKENASHYVYELRNYIELISKDPFNTIIKQYLDKPELGIDIRETVLQEIINRQSSIIDESKKPLEINNVSPFKKSKIYTEKRKISSSDALMELSDDERQMIIESRKKKAQQAENKQKEKERLSAQVKLDFTGSNPIEQSDGEYIISNNIFNLTLKQIEETPDITKYKLFFVDATGKIISNEQILEKRETGGITRVSFRLIPKIEFYEDEPYYLLIKDAENDNKLVGKLVYKIKITFTDDFGI